MTGTELDVRFRSHGGLKLDIAPCPKSANNGSRGRGLLDHLVGAGKQRRQDIGYVLQVRSEFNALRSGAVPPR